VVHPVHRTSSPPLRQPVEAEGFGLALALSPWAGQGRSGQVVSCLACSLRGLEGFPSAGPGGWETSEARWYGARKGCTVVLYDVRIS
jgi:hypothetical protein